MLNRGLDKVELLRIVEAVANEKSIDKEIVIESMESAIQKAALTKFGTENNIRVLIDRASGEIKIQKVAKALHKASGLHKQQAKTLDSIKAYQGKFIKHDSAGIKMSNESLVNYYGDLLK